jgi:hypothetical protein
LKRYIRIGLVVSVIGHLGLLIVGLLLVSADASHPPPPEAMVVEIVTPDELPRFEGTPSNQHSSGSETPSPADGKGAVTQAPPPKPRSQPQQQTQLVRATAPEKQNPSPEPEPASSPPTEQQPNIAEVVAQYVARGGPLGGIAAPPVDTDQAAYDWTVPFRERVGSCSRPPEGIELGDKVVIKVRVSFNRDGTVASPPRLLVSAPSAKQQALMEIAADALERCQPYTMLPPEKYKQWKMMVLYVTPLIARW